MNLNRRNFLLGASQLALSASFSPDIFAAESKTRFEFALSQYSLRKLFKNGSLKVIDFPAFTKDTFGIKAIDLWEGGLPKDKLDDTKYFESLKNKSDSLGIDLFLYMAGTLHTVPNSFQSSYDKIIKSLDRGKILGVRFLRIFLLTEDLKQAESAMTKLCEEASKRKIKIIIEPIPKGKGREGAFLAELYKKMNNPYLTLMPDFGKLKGNVYEGTKAMLPYSDSISAKMHSFDDLGKQPDFDYDRLARMIIDSSYKGYITIEWEGRVLEPVAGVKASQKLLLESFRKYGAKIS